MQDMREEFYRRLLALETIVEPAPLVTQAVELITDITGARLGYVELFPIVPSEEPPFRASHCDEGPAEAERWVSRDIVRAAVEERTTINLASALEHPRFRMSKSVVANAIKAVLCTPIGIGGAGIRTRVAPFGRWSGHASSGRRRLRGPARTLCAATPRRRVPPGTRERLQADHFISNAATSTPRKRRSQ